MGLCVDLRTTFWIACGIVFGGVDRFGNSSWVSLWGKGFILIYFCLIFRIGFWHLLEEIWPELINPRWRSLTSTNRRAMWERLMARKIGRAKYWHSKKMNSQTTLQPVQTMSNMSTLSKDKSQIGWRPVHPWWTNQWFELHWFSGADSEPNVIFWRKPKRLTPSVTASFILTPKA